MDRGAKASTANGRNTLEKLLPQGRIQRLLSVKGIRHNNAILNSALRNITTFKNLIQDCDNQKDEKAPFSSQQKTRH